MRQKEPAVTAPALADELQELEDFKQLLDSSMDTLRADLAAADADVTGEEFIERQRQTVGRWSAMVNRTMPPALDAEEVAELRGDLVEILAALTAYEGSQPLDYLDTVIVRLEAIRHIVRDAIDGHVPPAGDARTLLTDLARKLPNVTQKELARLLGTSDRSIQRNLKSDTSVTPQRRLVIVARLVELLRRAWTPEGVVAWFFRPRAELGNQAPFDLLDDPGAERSLLGAARQGRAQHGS
jgi:transcriptional regulator with XRE-family HTH domain